MHRNVMSKKAACGKNCNSVFSMYIYFLYVQISDWQATKENSDNLNFLPLLIQKYRETFFRALTNSRFQKPLLCFNSNYEKASITLFEHILPLNFCIRWV